MYISAIYGNKLSGGVRRTLRNGEQNGIGNFLGRCHSIVQGNTLLDRIEFLLAVFQGVDPIFIGRGIALRYDQGIGADAVRD